MKNYRPISNLSFMSKIVERIVLQQLSQYFDANGLLPKLQSGFRRHHFTESALLRVLSDLFSSVDNERISLLALLDVSAVFDTVDHAILLDRLSISFGITGSAFDWMRSFIVGRTQTVHYCVGLSRIVLLCVPVWLKDRCLDLSSTSSTLPTSRSWSNHLGSVFICTWTTLSFMVLQGLGRGWSGWPCHARRQRDQNLDVIKPPSVECW